MSALINFANVKTFSGQQEVESTTSNQNANADEMADLAQYVQKDENNKMISIPAGNFAASNLSLAQKPPSKFFTDACVPYESMQESNAASGGTMG